MNTIEITTPSRCVKKINKTYDDILYVLDEFIGSRIDKKCPFFDPNHPLFREIYEGRSNKIILLSLFRGDFEHINSDNWNSSYGQDYCNFCNTLTEEVKKLRNPLEPEDQRRIIFEFLSQWEEYIQRQWSSLEDISKHELKLFKTFAQDQTLHNIHNIVNAIKYLIDLDEKLQKRNKDFIRDFRSLVIEMDNLLKDKEINIDFYKLTRYNQSLIQYINANSLEAQNKRLRKENEYLSNRFYGRNLT